MTRSLYLAVGVDGKLEAATTMDHAVLEVLSVPDEYTNDNVRLIAESVFNAGVIDARARSGARGGPIRITWAALIEKGMDAGVLALEDA